MKKKDDDKFAQEQRARLMEKKSRFDAKAAAKLCFRCGKIGVAQRVKIETTSPLGLLSIIHLLCEGCGKGLGRYLLEVQVATKPAPPASPDGPPKPAAKPAKIKSRPNK